MLWGLIALAFANWASLFDNLIEVVNILGSVFYGTILGIFLTGPAVFYAALIAQGTVIVLAATSDIAFLWFNVIGCMLVVGIAPLLARRVRRRPKRV